MTENLRLNLNTNTPITPQYSNVATDWTPDNNTQTTLDVIWASRSVVPAEYNTARSYTYGSQTISTYDGGIQPVGNYYNWYAATAGTGTYEVSSTTASGSICPKGWQLPNENGSKSFYSLMRNTYNLQNTAAATNVARSTPLSYVYSGYYFWYNNSSYNTVHRFNDLGIWASNQSNGNTLIYDLTIDTNPEVFIDSHYAHLKVGGTSVRCINS